MRSVVDSLTACCPEFPAFLEANKYPFARRDGTLSTHGVFFVLTEFVLGEGPDMDDEELGALFSFREQYLHTGKLGNAIQTCFLENLKNTPQYPRIRGLLGPDSQHYLDTTPFA